MAVYYKSGNSWDPVVGYVKNGSSWEPVQCVYANINGSWEVICCDELTELDETFESGTLDNWNVNNSDFVIKTDNVFQGTYSAGIEDSFNSVYLYATYPMSDTRQISEMTFHYYETSSQSGSGVRLYNSNGNQELGIATNNPQWVFAPTDNEADIVEVFDGGDDPNGGGSAVYNTWHRVNLVFDWGVPEVSWTWENLDDGITKTGTQPVQQGVDVDFVELHQFKGFGGEAWATSGTPSAAMWYDNITIEK